jgi:hypothetical protein
VQQIRVGELGLIGPAGDYETSVRKGGGDERVYCPSRKAVVVAESEERGGWMMPNSELQAAKVRGAE